MVIMETHEIIALIISFCVLIISFFGYLNNRKLIKESLRPYVAVYFLTSNHGYTKRRVIIKNFGKTAATITKFKHENITQFINTSNDGWNPLDKIENTILAPGQKIIIDCSREAIREFNRRDPNLTFKFNVEYKDSSRNIYKEEFTELLMNREDEAKYRPDINATKEDLEKMAVSTLMQISDNQL